MREDDLMGEAENGSSATLTCVRTGAEDEYRWSLYAGRERDRFQQPCYLYIYPESGLAFWNDKVLTLKGPDGSSRSGTEMLSPAFERPRIGAVRSYIGAQTELSDDFYLRLVIGAFLWSKQTSTTPWNNLELRSITSRHSLAHIESTLLDESLSVAQRWHAVQVASRHPNLSLELVAALTKARYDWSPSGQDKDAGRYWDDAAFISPAVFFTGQNFEAVRFYGLTDTLWWYLYRIATDFLSVENARAAAAGGSFTPVEPVFSYATDRGFVSVADCQHCPNQDTPARLADHTGDLDWGDYEFFGGDLTTAVAPLDGLALKGGNYSDFISLLRRFHHYRLADSIELDHGLLKNLVELDHLPCPPLVLDQAAAFVPVPVGFFDAFRVALEGHSFGEHGGGEIPDDLISLTAAGFDPGVSVTGQPHRLTGATSVEDNPYRGHLPANQLLSETQMASLVSTGVSALGLTGAEANTWYSEQMADLSSITISCPGLSVETDTVNSSMILRGVTLSGVGRIMVSAIRDYYENPECCGTLLLSWHLNLRGLTAT